MKLTNAELEKAKQFIRDFWEEEYDELCEEDEDNFKDLSCVPLAYTEFTNMDIPCVVCVDLVNMKLNTYIGDDDPKKAKLVESIDYDLDALECLDFDALTGEWESFVKEHFEDYIDVENMTDHEYCEILENKYGEPLQRAIDMHVCDEIKDDIYEEMSKFQMKYMEKVLADYEKTINGDKAKQVCYDALEYAVHHSESGSSIVYVDDKETADKVEEIIWDEIGNKYMLDCPVISEEDNGMWSIDCMFGGAYVPYWDGYNEW